MLVPCRCTICYSITKWLSYCTYDAVWYNIVWLLPTLRQNYPIKITINAAIISEIISERKRERVREREVLCVSKLAYGSCVRVKGCAVQLQTLKWCECVCCQSSPFRERVRIRWHLIVEVVSHRRASSQGGKSKTRPLRGVEARWTFLLSSRPKLHEERRKSLAISSSFVLISTTAEIHSFSLPLVFSFLNFIRESSGTPRVKSVLTDRSGVRRFSLCAFAEGDFLLS